MENRKQEKWVVSGLVVAALLFAIVAILTNIPAGGADNYAHFNISRWAFRYPYLFFDHWGKPVFTILTAPFAQFGMVGVRLFNIICGMLTAWYVYKLARMFHWQYAWFAVFPVIFTPIYFVMMSTAMTEVLFSLILVVSIYWFFKEKFLFSAILISCIFLVRTEGMAFLVLFLTAFVIKKQYAYIPFLLTGFVFFSIVGWIYPFHNILWLIHELPYATGAASVYGSGSWYHFLVNMPKYFGYLTPIFLFAGTIMLASHWLRAGIRSATPVFFLVLLVMGSFWGYFFTHSYLWWVGETSAGLFRVMAGVSPLIAIMAVYLLHTLFTESRWRKVKTVVVAGFALILAITSAAFYHKAVSRDMSAEILARTSAWLKKPEHARHKLVVHNPYFAFSTGRDAWDNQVIQYGFSSNEAPETGLPDSTLFVWDAHFSANEGRMSLEQIMDNPHVELVEYFEPVVPFQVMWGNDYQIFIFRFIHGVHADNHALLRQIKLQELAQGVYYTDGHDFEEEFQDSQLDGRRLFTYADNATYVYTLGHVEFSPVFTMQEADVKKGSNKLRLTLDALLLEEVAPSSLFMVFSIESGQGNLHYATYDITSQVPETGIWQQTEFVFQVPDRIQKGAVLQAYIWNIEKRQVLIDNFKLELFRQDN